MPPARHIIRWIPLAVLALMLAGCQSNTPAPDAAPGKPHSATLKWTASTSKVTEYRIYRTTELDAPPGLLAVTAAKVTQFDDTTVEAGRTYYYSVTAVDASGAESPAAKISATIPNN